MRQPLAKRVAAEAFGTFFLLAAVVGSGIMAERLAQGTLALLANTAATGTPLVALIISFASISGAHFNPVVTLSLRGDRFHLAGCSVLFTSSGSWSSFAPRSVQPLPFVGSAISAALAPLR